MKPVVILKGKEITSEKNFHDEVARLLKFPDFYGKNLDAFGDLMSAHMDTNIILTWEDHQVAKESMPETFANIIGVFDEVKGMWENFEYRLE